MKEIPKEEEVDLMLNTKHQIIQDKILLNTRIAAVQSKYTSTIVGAVIISTLFNLLTLSWVGACFMWAWLGLAIWAYVKRKKELKLITELD